MKQSNYSSLFMIVFADFSLEVWDSSKLKKARHFQLKSCINDAFFTPDNKFVFACSQDNIMSIYEIMSGKLINQI